MARDKITGRYSRNVGMGSRQGPKLPSRASRKPRKFNKPSKLPIGFPMSTTVKLRYCDQGALDASGAPAVEVFSANGLYDPNISHIGHQPSFYDTYSAIYNQYVVLYAKAKCTFWTEEGANNYASIVGIKLDDSNSISPSTTVEEIIEQPSKLFKWRFMRNNASNEKSLVKVTNEYRPKKFFGIDDVKDNRKTIGADVGANPSEQAYFLLCQGHPDGSTDIPQVYYQIIIDYIVQFSELKDISQS